MTIGYRNRSRFSATTGRLISPAVRHVLRDTRAGWTTDENPTPIDELPATAKSAPTWVWGAVFVLAAIAILLLVNVEAFKP